MRATANGDLFADGGEYGAGAVVAVPDAGLLG
jgi:hypothetical protein